LDAIVAAVAWAAAKASADVMEFAVALFKIAFAANNCFPCKVDTAASLFN
jgi:hypothetical protein